MQGGLEIRTLRAFRDDEGSTSLAMVLSVFLVVCLLAVTMQVYWVNSTAGDVQTVADLAAMSGANTISKVYSTYQFLDGLILGLSLTMLFLRLLSIVMSWIPYIGTVVGKALGGAADQVRNLRNRLQDTADSFMRGLLVAAPFLSVANSVAVIEQNNAELASRNRPGSYHGVCIPLPFKVELPPKDTEDLGDPESSGTEGEVEKQSAEYRKASEDTTRAMVAGFSADVYSGQNRPPVNPKDPDINAVNDYYVRYVENKWSFPNNPRDDFQRALTVATRGLPESTDLWGGSAWGTGSDSVNMRRSVDDTYDAMDEYVRSQVRSWGYVNTYAAFGQKTVHSSADDIANISAVVWNGPSQIQYHESASCSRLTGSLATPLSLVDVTNQYDGLMRPCDKCRPIDYRAWAAWEAAWDRNDAMGQWLAFWILEADAHAWWEASTGNAKAAEDAAVKKITEWLNGGFEEAIKKLVGLSERATYDFPGNAGFIAVVADAGTRHPPSGMLYGLVGRSSYGPRLAVAGAMLAPTNESLFPTLFDDVKSGQSPWNWLGGIGDGVASTLGWVLDGYARGVTGLMETVKSLLGGGSFAQKVTGALESALIASGLSAPDTRVVKPVLVNTYHVGQGTSLSGGYRTLKSKYDDYAVYANSPEQAKAQLKSDIGEAVRGVVDAELQQLTLELQIETPAGTVTIPIQLPEPVREGVTSVVGDRLDDLLGAW
jgi:hypothetical protein